MLSSRVLISNGVKIALLLPILLGVPRSIAALCFLGIAISLAVDYRQYKRDQALDSDLHANENAHVPLPPSRSPRP